MDRTIREDSQFAQKLALEAGAIAGTPNQIKRIIGDILSGDTRFRRIIGTAQDGHRFAMTVLKGGPIKGTLSPAMREARADTIVRRALVPMFAVDIGRRGWRTPKAVGITAIQVFGTNEAGQTISAMVPVREANRPLWITPGLPRE